MLRLGFCFDFPTCEGEAMARPREAPDPAPEPAAVLSRRRELLARLLRDRPLREAKLEDVRLELDELLWRRLWCLCLRLWLREWRLLLRLCDLPLDLLCDFSSRPRPLPRLRLRGTNS